MSTTIPTAAIAVSNGRTKDQLPKYAENTYYLKDGQEFIIMLYNPTQKKVGAKLYINGKAEFSMLVLKPGQRIWLERFIDTQKKFVFETYEVEDTKEGHIATSNNGKIRVEFYEEFTYVSPIIYVEQPVYVPSPTYPGWPIHRPYIYYDTLQQFNNVNDCKFELSGGTKSACVPGNVTTNYCSQISSDASIFETGRIEAGEHSSQEFGQSYDQFNTYYSYCIDMLLLPEKYVPAEKVKVYCTQCGRAKKPGDVYCVTCGTKY